MIRRARRPDDARYLPKDAAAWRVLIRRAEIAARRADQGPCAEALARAAHLAARSVPPPGHGRRDSVFLALVTRAATFAGCRAPLRIEQAGALGRLAAEAEAALAAHEAGQEFGGVVTRRMLGERE